MADCLSRDGGEDIAAAPAMTFKKSDYKKKKKKAQKKEQGGENQEQKMDENEKEKKYEKKKAPEIEEEKKKETTDPKTQKEENEERKTELKNDTEDNGKGTEQGKEDDGKAKEEDTKRQAQSLLESIKNTWEQKTREQATDKKDIKKEEKEAKGVADEPIISNKEWIQELTIDEEWRRYMKYRREEAPADKLTEKQAREFRRLDGFLTLQDGLLVAKTKHKLQEVLAVVVPWKFRQRILHEYHNTPESGHRADRPMTDRIRQKYYWPGLGKDVQTYCRKCLDCKIAKIKAR